MPPAPVPAVAPPGPTCCAAHRGSSRALGLWSGRRLAPRVPAVLPRTMTQARLQEPRDPRPRAGGGSCPNRGQAGAGLRCWVHATLLEGRRPGHKAQNSLHADHRPTTPLTEGKPPSSLGPGPAASRGTTLGVNRTPRRVPHEELRGHREAGKVLVTGRAGIAENILENRTTGANQSRNVPEPTSLTDTQVQQPPG